MFDARPSAFRHYAHRRSLMIGQGTVSLLYGFRTHRQILAAIQPTKYHGYLVPTYHHQASRTLHIPTSYKIPTDSKPQNLTTTSKRIRSPPTPRRAITIATLTPYNYLVTPHQTTLYWFGKNWRFPPLISLLPRFISFQPLSASSPRSQPPWHLPPYQPLLKPNFLITNTRLSTNFSHPPFPLKTTPLITAKQNPSHLNL